MRSRTTVDSASLWIISRLLLLVVCGYALRVTCIGCAVRIVERTAGFIRKNSAGRGKILAAVMAVALLLPGAAHAGTPPAAPDGFAVYSFQDSIRERGHLLEPHFPAWMRWLDGEGDEAAATVERTVYGLIRQGVPPAVFEKVRIYLFPLYGLPCRPGSEWKYLAGMFWQPDRDGWAEIWLAGNWWALEETLVHEVGHLVQHRLLGGEWSPEGAMGEYLRLKGYPEDLDLAPRVQQGLPWHLKASEWFAQNFEAVYGPEGGRADPRIRNYFSALFTGKSCAGGKRSHPASGGT